LNYQDKTIVKHKIVTEESVAALVYDRVAFLSLCARRSLVRAAVVVLCVLGSAFNFPAQAATIARTNVKGGSCKVAANWSPNSVLGSLYFTEQTGTYGGIGGFLRREKGRA
jgi:hypothetical protein